jgi:hypothetical protein
MEPSLDNSTLDPGYSQHSDANFSWVPKDLKSNGPIPITYWNSDLTTCSGGLKTVYYGDCPKDSYSMHRQFKAHDPSYYYDFEHPLASAYDFLSRKLNKVHDTRPFTGMAPDCPDDCLHFNSTFECGNLDRVVMVSADEYDLYVRPDSNTGGNFQWFYFAVSNVRGVRHKRFNILNLSRKHSLYLNGRRPVFATQREGVWRPVGQSVNYGPSKLNQYLTGSGREYYSLSFDALLQQTYEEKLTKGASLCVPSQMSSQEARPSTPQEDVYLFADLPPYSFTRQLAFIQEVRDAANEGTAVRVDTLCNSLSGLEVPLVTITDPRFPSASKQSLLIVGRVHPGEAVASLVIEGLMRFLCSSDPEAVVLRQRLEVKVVPMLNPDGVVMGNSRTSISGCDLNQHYSNPDPVAHVEVWALKELISTHRNKIFAFVDVHGNSTKKGAFLQGPKLAVLNEQYYLSKVVSRLMSEHTQMFRNLRYNSKGSFNRKAPRAVIAKDFGITYSYTFCSSSYAYLNDLRQNIVMTQADYFYLGGLLVKTLSEFDFLLELDQICSEDYSSIRAQQRGTKVDKFEKPIRPRLKRAAANGVYSKLRTVTEIVRLIKAEHRGLEVESSGSDTDSSEEETDKDLSFIFNALSEVSRVVEGRFKHRTPTIKIATLANSNPVLHARKGVKLPSLMPSPNLSSDESHRGLATPSRKLFRRTLGEESKQTLEARIRLADVTAIRRSELRSAQRKPKQGRLQSRQVHPVNYHPITEVASTSLLPTPQIRHLKSMNKLHQILHKMEPQLSSSMNDISPKSSVSPTNTSYTVLQFPVQRSKEKVQPLSKSRLIRKMPKISKNLSIHSKFRDSSP